MSDPEGLPPALPWEALKPKANLVSREWVLDLCVALSLRVPGNIIETLWPDARSR
jgi:hypothetical protein